MNSCVVMAEIVDEPQLRYTLDDLTPVAETMVQFPGLRDEDRPSVLKLVAWGNLAQELQDQYHVGDRVIVEGRLGMISFDRPEGFKDKRAELTASRLHKVEGTIQSPVAVASTTATPVQSTTASAPKAKATPKAKAAKVPATVGAAASDIDYDDIPFAANPGHDDLIDSAIHRPVVGMEFRKF